MRHFKELSKLGDATMRGDGTLQTVPGGLLPSGRRKGTRQPIGVRVTTAKGLVVEPESKQETTRGAGAEATRRDDVDAFPVSARGETEGEEDSKHASRDNLENDGHAVGDATIVGSKTSQLEPLILAGIVPQSIVRSTAKGAASAGAGGLKYLGATTGLRGAAAVSTASASTPLMARTGRGRGLASHGGSFGVTAAAATIGT